jgi:hypothetical protein
MREMAGVLIGNTQMERLELAAELTIFHELRDVADAPCEGGCAFSEFRLVGEHLPVVLEMRATTGRISGDEVDSRRLERIHQAFCQLGCFFVAASMCRKRAAATLRSRDDDLVSTSSKDIRSRDVDTTENRTLYAPKEDPYPCSCLTVRRQDPSWAYA